jgi:photosystem II stability/assembly factor-like uncharacterized protein
MKPLIILMTIISLSSADAQYIERTFRLDAVDSTQPRPSSNSVSQILLSAGRAYFATSKGINLTTDGGNSFETDFGKNGPTGIGVNSIAITGDTIVASVSSSINQSGASLPVGQGLFVSTDNGTTWTKEIQSVDSTADTIVVFGIDTLRALPILTSVQNVSYSIAFYKHYLYSANWGGGLRRTSDLGKTWQRVVLPPDYLDYINGDSVYSFQLSVQKNTKFNTGEANLNQEAFSLYSDGDSALYVGTAGGIDKTTDNGHSWHKFDHANTSGGISGNFVVSLAAQNSGSVHRIWAATVVATDPTETSALSYTNDGGATWSNILNGHFFHGMAFHDSTIVYGVSDDGLFRTSDFGRSSQIITNIYDDFSKQSLLSPAFYAAASNGDSVWVASGDGSAVGIDNGSGFDLSKWHVLRAYATVNGNSTYFYPNPFSPHLDIGRFHFRIQNSGSQVTIRIYDFSMHIVKTVLQNSTRSAGDVDVPWNGTSDRGGMVDNGVYFYSVVINGGTPAWGKILVLR